MNLKTKKSLKIRKDRNKYIIFDTETELLHETNNIGYEIIKLCDGKNREEDIIKT